MGCDPARVKYKWFAPSLLPSLGGMSGWSRRAQPCVPAAPRSLHLSRTKSGSARPLSVHGRVEDEATDLFTLALLVLRPTKMMLCHILGNVTKRQRSPWHFASSSPPRLCKTQSPRARAQAGGKGSPVIIEAKVPLGVGLASQLGQDGAPDSQFLHKSIVLTMFECLPPR